ncbi:MAG: hypothetical protein U1D69_12195, partial [Polynucleobacter sp.]|nr:hypothetical protein [Polynucleobacter sp.]
MLHPTFATMTNLAISAVLLLSSLALLLFLKRKKQLAFPIVLITSTAYYALGGFWYWTSEADGFFVGLDWSTGLPFAVLLFCGATFLATFSYFLLLSSSKGRVSPLPINQDVLVFQNRRFLTVHLIGLISSAFVILTNSSRGPAFLIAYQFSDLLIATSLIAFALQPRSPYTVASLIYFIGYSVFVGFRYKLAIIAIPIMLVFYIANRGFKRWIYFFTLPSFVILAFSVITFTRVKFSGLNFDAVSEVDSTRLLYGLFAETNLLFGVVSIIDYVLPTYPPTYFGSAIDAVLELIPRALFPDRQTGDHMFYVLEGLQTQEGFNSGTAYPFFGEF